jgi:hydroxyethylthiazole kinase-like uncharacterized protein yjeF
MLTGYRVAAIREAEERAFAVVGPDALMQRAAAGLATAILRRLDGAYGARALLVLGSGNNGGDALFAGVRLLRRGVAVSAWPVGESVHEAGWAAFLAAGGRAVDGAAEALAVLPRQDLVVDGVAGIGSRPGLAPDVAAFASACVEAGVPVVAVDLPSGLAPEPPFGDQPYFHADLTVTFGGLKLCQLLEPARSACGIVEFVDIGLELGEPAVVQWERDDLAAHWPVPGPTADKYSRGVVGLDTGSTDFPGAAMLGTSGAVHAGAGMVRYLGAGEVAARVIERFPNVVPAKGRVQSLVLGSGWGERRDGSAVSEAIASGLPVVVDADGLRHLPGSGGHPGVVLTPHAGELAWLLGCERTEVTADPMAAVLRASEKAGCTVLLKGATQYVAVPGSQLVRTAVPGPAWTAQAGSGDTLAGICGTLLAAGLEPADAALAAASVQALAASEHPGPLPPQELAERLPAVIARLVTPSE